MSVELVEVDRCGFRECVHRGSLVILDPDGEPAVAVGNAHLPIYPRSVNKPLQTVAMLRNGFAPRDDAETAIATASHDGEHLHVELVRRLLDRFGLVESQLRCPPDLPGNETARAAAVVAGSRRRAVFMNCSGKHAAMLVTCIVNDWPTGTYPEPGHPMQRAVAQTVTELTGEPETDFGIDGCGLPIVPVSLVNLARAYRKLVTAAPGTARRRVADAIRAHPIIVSGTDRDDARLMTATPGLVTKSGADGVHAGALPDGSAFAFKIEDGHERARLPLAAAVLRRMGVAWSEDHAEMAAQPVYGGGARVGTVRAIPGLL